MVRRRGHLQRTQEGQVVGKQQLYAMLVDSTGNPVLDAEGNTQVEEVGVIGGKVRTLTELTGSIAKDMVPVTPSDTDNLAGGDTIGLYVGGAGNVVVIMANGNERTITALSAGIIHPISVKRVKATNTTATNIMAVYAV